MSAAADGGCAFPRANDMGDGVPGMTIRDYFAAQALAGWLASWPPGEDTLTEVRSSVASTVYGMADAMLREREKEATDG